MTSTLSRERIGIPAIAALAVGLTVGYLAGDILPEVVDALQSDLGMSASAAGGVTTVLLLATALAGLLCARRAGRPGRARFAALGALVGAGGYTLAAFADEPPVLIGACVLAGLGSGVVLAFATAAISVTSDPERASGLAILVNTAVGAVLLFTLPRIAGSQATPTFLVMAVVGLLALPLFRWLPDADEPKEGDADGSPLPSIGMGAMIFAGALLLDVTDNGMWAFVGTLVMENVGLSASELGAILAVATVAGLAGASLPIVLGDRGGLFVPIIAMIGVDALAKTAIVLVTTPTAYAVTQFLWTGSYAALFAYLLAVGAKLDSFGRWAAIVGSAFAMGDAIGPLLFGMVTDLGGETTLVVMMVASSVAVALLLGPPTMMLDRRRRAAA